MEEMKKFGMEEMGVMEEPYLYGTHYSVSGHIIGFLIRVEPYTTMHLEL